MKTVLTGFSPIIDENSKVIILGSMPSVVSLEKAQYYGHKQNRFWRIIFEYFSKPLSFNYEERIALLREGGIALWDSIGECEREGSLDSSIKKEKPNDIDGLLRIYTNIKQVFVNGNKAEAVYSKYNKSPYVKLPSTSPANAAYSYGKLFAIWKEQLDRFI